MQIRNGPKQGFSKNFLSMACDADIKAEFYAFSDQDDVWMIDKLERALEYISHHYETKLPVAYGSRTLIVDENLKPLGLSPEFKLPRSFRNALVQSIAGGNTQLFNHSAKKLLEEAGLQNVVSHDWWLYQLIEGNGGVFHYDVKPSLMYRQHTSALIGGNLSILGKIKRVQNVVNGSFKEWVNINLIALRNSEQLLTKTNKEILTKFSNLRNKKLIYRIIGFKTCRIYRQSRLGTISLWISVIFNKV